MSQVRRGRPRSEAARLAILEASRDLLAELGYPAMTMEAIAVRAGVSKQTIYRWWSSKAIVVADAVLSGLVDVPSAPVPDTGSLKEDLQSWALSIGSALSQPSGASVMSALITAASEEPDEATRLFDHLTGPYYRALIDRLRVAQARGQLSERAEPDAVADALIGTILFRVLARLPVSESLAGVIDALLPSGDGRRQEESHIRDK